MKFKISMGLSLLISFPLAYANHDNFDELSPQVEYVHLCSLDSHPGLTAPGSDKCLNPLTGIFIVETAHGFITGESELSARITVLESQLRQAQEQLGLQFTETHE